MTIVSVLVLSSCSPIKSNSEYAKDTSQINYLVKKKENTWNLETPPSLNEIKLAVKNDQVNTKVTELGDWWFYGPGIGRTALNVGTVIVFPPYALYLLTNAGLSLTGHKPLNVLDILPTEQKEIAENAYDSITQVPGRITSIVAGKEYFSREIKNEAISSQDPTNNINVAKK